MLVLIVVLHVVGLLVQLTLNYRRHSQLLFVPVARLGQTRLVTNDVRSAVVGISSVTVSRRIRLSLQLNLLVLLLEHLDVLVHFFQLGAKALNFYLRDRKFVLCLDQASSFFLQLLLNLFH